MHIPGLEYVEAYLDAAAEQHLIAALDAAEWLTSLSRRVQHYGYRYDYEARSVSPESYLGPLPPWLATLADRLQVEGRFSVRPDQVIINEYQPGQGISAHVDCVPCFTETIASLTLGAGCVMQFVPTAKLRARSSDLPKSVAQWLAPRSLVVLKDVARYDWKHAIPARQSDIVDEVRIPRGRRLSLTFRKVIEPS